MGERGTGLRTSVAKITTSAALWHAVAGHAATARLDARGPVVVRSVEDLPFDIGQRIPRSECFRLREPACHVEEGVSIYGYGSTLCDSLSDSLLLLLCTIGIVGVIHTSSLCHWPKGRAIVYVPRRMLLHLVSSESCLRSRRRFVIIRA